MPQIDVRTMELRQLKQHILTLATLPETEAPVVSCYLALSAGAVADRNEFEAQVAALKIGSRGMSRRDLADAIKPIEAYLATELSPEAKGLAVFSRAGDTPYFLPLPVHISLPNWIVADSTPNLFHLVELKDSYHRYVLMICSETRARILEVNLGAVTAELWRQRPETRQRVGRTWTKRHYQHHRRGRAEQFLKEKVAVLERLMSSEGHVHLILAGDRRITDRLRRELPEHLLAQLVGVIPASSTSRDDTDVVQSTIASLIAAEQTESHETVDELLYQLRQGHLAAAGTKATHRALYCGQADVVVIAKQYAPGLGWTCGECGFTELEQPRPDTSCPECDARALHDFDIKEAIVRMAERHGCIVEVVNESEPLQRLGGIGCLLRYRLSDSCV
ncbi:peptide chain release factor 1 [Novipirellula galeiformis]|uniref:Peptide chain release factor 1 n=1 Tax=Novipirellula galeiformis TaxID=2528004 RepID=A0A5C6C9Y9_9BACT|nr:hypothetical protein [Novipirellula galeiformis]TWU20952.1 peptide chain release factor 1 [Novipirellula galeiformis]